MSRVSRASVAPLLATALAAALAVSACATARPGDETASAGSTRPLAPRGLYVSEAAPGASSTLNFYDAEHYLYWAPGCAVGASCVEEGRFTFDALGATLSLEPLAPAGPVRTAAFDVVETGPGAGAADVAPRDLVVKDAGTGLVARTVCLLGSVRTFLLGALSWNAPPSAETQSFQTALSEQLRPDAVLTISPASPEGSFPQANGPLTLTWNGMPFCYTWERPGGWTIHYTVRRCDGGDVVATAGATTSCDQNYLPHDWRCRSRHATFAWEQDVDAATFANAAPSTCL